MQRLQHSARRQWRRLALLSLIALQVTGAKALGACPPLTMPELARMAKDQRLELVFFASWCSACKSELSAPADAQTLYIGTFDTRERAEKVIAALNPQGRCFTDAGIAEALGVNAVPAKRTYPAR